MAQGNHFISFIVPCYNYARYLPDCLNSIFAQEGEFDFEIIAIDDCSTDNTQEVLRSFKDSRLKVIYHPKNLGHAATINEGISVAGGSFIARIDPDDRYRRHFLSATLEKFSAYPEVGLVYGDAALIDEDGKITCENSDKLHGGKDVLGNALCSLLQENFICAPTVIARSKAWQQALPVPGHLAFNDWYFTLKMAREYDFYYINSVLADYRVHGENWHSKVVREKKEEASILWMLDYIFSTQEKGLLLQEQKIKAKRRVYAAQYLTLANKYFGFQMGIDAKRCYLRALSYRFDCIFRPYFLRRLAASVLGVRAYERVKSFIKSKH